MKDELLRQSIEVPCELKNLQEWFASIIVRPLVENDRINPIAPNGTVISQEAAHFILPRPNLMPHKRLEIYNQQFWWRLLNILQINFPFTLRLLSHKSFKEITIQYLMKCPPNHWSLTTIGRELPRWIKENYDAKDKELICYASEIDLVFYESSISAQHPSLSLDSLSKYDSEALLVTNLYLQPGLFLVEYPYDLPIFREIVIKKEPEVCLESLFPDLPHDHLHNFAIFRNQKNIVCWKEISQAEFLLMQQFKEGTSILKACDWIGQNNEVLQTTMTEYFQTWVQNWVRLGWLTIPSPACANV